MSESTHLWDMLQRTYAGNAWHGPALRNLLGEVSAAQAATRAVPGAHTIWETADHLALYEDAARRRLAGEAVPEMDECARWPEVHDTSAAAWRRTLDHVEAAHLALRRALASFPDERMGDVVPGRDYPYYVMLHGLIEHEQFHAGQIMVLMQAQGLTPCG